MSDIKTSPLISIVLATYNGAIFLAEQLDSLLQQTYQNIEIIAVDDQSIDSTVSILHEYAAKHPNMKVFVNGVNLGYRKNFEKACSLSNGAFIALCDQDDYWHPEKIEKLLSATGSNAMIYCDSYICDKSLQKTGTKISDVAVCRDFTSCLQQSVFCRIYGHTTLFRRELLTKAIPFPDVIPHDWWLAYLATTTGNIKFYPEPLVYYRQHDSNMIGVINVKRDKKAVESANQKKKLEIIKIRTRINDFYNACDEKNVFEKTVLRKLAKSYQSFSLINNSSRMILFFKYQELLLSSKKRSLLRQYLFCLKMFVMIK